ncbi:MAG: tetratricopeptide repeat protein [Alphaproteobacteria bacterium]|nr:tetratricopeptide repeat protein [Alphaproteobacteria bacterium]
MHSDAERKWGKGLVVALLSLMTLMSLTACAGMGGGNPDPRESSGSIYGDLLVARIAGGERDAEIAASRYAAAVRADPGNADLIERAFLYSLSAGDTAAAYAYADELVAKGSDAPLPRLARGVRDINEARYDSAAAEFAAAGNGTASSFTASVLSAWALAGKKDWDGALKLLDEAPGREKNRQFVNYHRGLIRAQAGRWDAAGKAFAEALEGERPNPRIIEAELAVLCAMGRMEGARDILASAGADTGSPLLEAARARLNAGKPVPLPAATAREGLAEALYGLAGAAVQDRGIDLPILSLRLAIDARPDFDVGLTFLAELYEAAEKWDLAQGAYRRIGRDSPFYENAQIAIARLLDEEDKTDEAIETLDALAAKAKDGFNVRVAKGDVLRKRERWAQAATAYAEALADLKAPERRHWVVYYMHGITLERSKKWDEAERQLQTALKLEPDQPLVLNYLGYTWIEHGVRLDEAMAMIERAVELRPTDGYIIDSLGWAHYRLGNYKKAVEYIEQAVLLQPGDPTINDHLGDAYWKVGRQREARFQWRHALTFKPEDDQVPLIRDKLENGLDRATVAREARDEGPAR